MENLIGISDSVCVCVCLRERGVEPEKRDYVFICLHCLQGPVDSLTITPFSV